MKYAFPAFVVAVLAGVAYYVHRANTATGTPALKQSTRQVGSVQNVAAANQFLVGQAVASPLSRP